MTFNTTYLNLPVLGETDQLGDVPEAMLALAARLGLVLPRSGTAVVPVTASSSGALAVVFPVGAFTVPPRVLLQVSNTITYRTNPITITANGFTVNVVHNAGTSATTNVTVFWAAFPVL